MVVPELRRLRLKQALSQKELGRAANLTAETVCRLEAGYAAYPSTVRKLASALGVAPGALMGEAADG